MGWITLHGGEDEEGGGVHVFIGDGGRITKGPKGLLGGRLGHLKAHAKITRHPAGHEPAGARAHPHYAEHHSEMVKKHVYGRKGPGVGYDITIDDNPLRPLSPEETHQGLIEARHALQKPAAKAKASTHEALTKEQRGHLHEAKALATSATLDPAKHQEKIAAIVQGAHDAAAAELRARRGGDSFGPDFAKNLAHKGAAGAYERAIGAVQDRLGTFEGTPVRRGMAEKISGLQARADAAGIGTHEHMRAVSAQHLQILQHYHGALRDLRAAQAHHTATATEHYTAWSAKRAAPGTPPEQPEPPQPPNGGTRRPAAVPGGNTILKARPYTIQREPQKIEPRAEVAPQAEASTPTHYAHPAADLPHLEKMGALEGRMSQLRNIRSAIPLYGKANAMASANVRAEGVDQDLKYRDARKKLVAQQYDRLDEETKFALEPHLDANGKIDPSSAGHADADEVNLLLDTYHTQFAHKHEAYLDYLDRQAYHHDVMAPNAPTLSPLSYATAASHIRTHGASTERHVAASERTYRRTAQDARFGFAILRTMAERGNVQAQRVIATIDGTRPVSTPRGRL